MPKNRILNQYYLDGEFGVGYDSKKRVFYFDLEDYDKIKNYTWCVCKSSVMTKVKNNSDYGYGTILMHRLIMDYDGCLLIDHVNHTVFDNRKKNLRLANKIQNGQNRKNSIGWRYESKKKRYSARIRVCKKEIHLGYFDDSESARVAYIKAREKYFKEFSPTEEK